LSRGRVRPSLCVCVSVCLCVSIVGSVYGTYAHIHIHISLSFEHTTHTHTHTGGEGTALRFSPTNPRLLVVGYKSGAVCLVDLGSKEVVATLKAHALPVRSIQFHAGTQAVCVCVSMLILSIYEHSCVWCVCVCVCVCSIINKWV
jgi:WD40 repeat protein